MPWPRGAHAPSRAVVGAPADHTGARERVTVQCLNWAFIPTAKASVGTGEGADAPQFRLSAYGLAREGAWALQLRSIVEGRQVPVNDWCSAMRN